MKSPLYLDTARLGLMAPKVKDALNSLTQIASVDGLSSRFDDFLHGGFKAWPTSLQKSYPGLSDWQGILELKSSLRKLVGLSSEKPVFLASRSTSLMKVAARLLFQRCRRVLVTDLEWPGFLEILRQERDRVGREIVEVPIRALVFKGDMSSDDICQTISDQYCKRQVDGLFLSVLSYQGIRLPVTTITRDLENSRKPPEFIVLDDAQGIGHIPHDFSLEDCDLLLAGCHKWLRSHNPLGLGFSIRRRSQEFVRLTMEAMAKSWEADDPLLSFSAQLEGNFLESFSETVNLLGVFSARAALADPGNESGPAQFNTLLKNCRTLARAADGSAWKPLVPHPSLQSGIALFQAKESAIKVMPPKPLRDHFLKNGVALSSYQEGLVRVSVPKVDLSNKEVRDFSSALFF